MKKKFLRTVQTYGVLLLCVAFVISCKDDDEMVNTPDLPTCTDGIMNGDETGIDCGGTCQPCEEGMTLGRRTELYVTNNANGDITKYSVTGDSLVTFSTTAEAAEGIYYDADEDLLVQASRTGLQLDAYKGTSLFMADTDATADFSSAADLESPRELAVKGSTYVVSDNGSHKFFVYTKDGDSFSLTSTVEVPFPVWGVTFKGNDLYAVVDQSSDLAVFSNFEANAVDGPMAPSKRVTIEGIVRTHGLAYSGSDDVMILTDIGDATNTTDDGGFHIIADFTMKFDKLSDGDVLTLANQTRVAGSSTLMGNPIDVAYDAETDAVYISEIGNGKVLGFTNIGEGGNLAPTFNKDLAMASSIYFSSDETDGDIGTETTGQVTYLYSTNNANGDINVYDGMGTLVKTVTSESTASEGIYYSALNNAVIQASRSNLKLENYADFSGSADGSSITSSFASAAELMSPREIAVSGDKVVVSDNAEHKFYVYSYEGAAFTLMNTFEVDFNVWGVTFKGENLLAVVDVTSDLAIFENFFENNMTDGAITADKQITIEGIVRTHGIDYSEADDVLVMSDIGDAADANTDGGFQVIQDFSKKLDATEDGGSIALADQTRIAGAATLMGNPIDVAYDHKTKTVFVAEVGNGKILGFTDVLNSSGNVAPSINNDLAMASSIYLYSN